jgi:Ca2+-binding EF-hand superfamily protein
MEDADP